MSWDLLVVGGSRTVCFLGLLNLGSLWVSFQKHTDISTGGMLSQAPFGVPLWSTVGFHGKDLGSQQSGDLSASWPGMWLSTQGQGYRKALSCLSLSSGLLEPGWKGKG